LNATPAKKNGQKARRIWWTASDRAEWGDGQQQCAEQRPGAVQVGEDVDGAWYARRAVERSEAIATFTNAGSPGRSVKISAVPGEKRLAPIAMTALVTALALMPLVIWGDRPGHEIEHPMAIVILGGLVSSTVLNLLLMPALYLRYGVTEQRSDEVTT